MMVSKYMWLALTILCLLALNACGDPTGAEETVTGAVDQPPLDAAAEEAETPEPENVTEVTDPWLRMQYISQWSGDLDGMIDRGFVRMLVPPSKTFYFLDGAVERGIGAASRAALEQFLNDKLKAQKKSVEVIAVPVQRKNLVEAIAQGYGDIGVGNWTATDARQKQVDFVDYGYARARELIVLSPNSTGLSDASGLSGREVFVRKTSSYYTSLLRLNESLKSAGKPEVVIRMADENLEDEDIIEMVNANLLPATVIDSHKWDWLWKRVFTKVQVNPDVFIRENRAVGPMIRKESPQITALVQEFVKKHPPGSAWFNTVLNQYYKKSKWILNAAASSERKKFEAVIPLFEKYGAQYEFDELMLAAQGYQESRLDQNAKSHVGAIGVMQLMPTTAAGNPVFIPNVDELEPNIEAGTKYMRYLIDKYFADPEIDEVNKYLFAFAAYNAGPNRVARLRKKAGEDGLNQNEWFNNVERVVAGKVGQEPVRYVRNIYKYYVAYKRLRELDQRRGTGGDG